MYGGKANSILQKSVIVREIALADEPNLNFRPKMEDGKNVVIQRTLLVKTSIMTWSMEFMVCWMAMEERKLQSM